MRGFRTSASRGGSDGADPACGGSSHTLRQALAETLRRAWIDVAEAADGRMAMEFIESGGYDLALFDLKMPVHHGLDLLKASRARWPSRRSSSSRPMVPWRWRWKP